MTRSRPQDAPASTSGARQDAPVGSKRPTPKPVQSQDSPLEAGWYPSPDGSPTLSWWTGQGWSSTQGPIPKAPTIPVLNGQVVSADPAQGSPRRRWPGRDRRKGYLRAVLLTAFLGPFGLIFVRWQLAVAYFVVVGPLSAVVGDHWAPHTSVWSRPVSIVLAVLSVAWHNHRVDGTPTPLHRR